MPQLRVLVLATRLALRDVRRAWRQTLLMLLLIALAVAGYVAVATVQRTFQPTAAGLVTRVLGTADLRVYPKTEPVWQPAAIDDATGALAAKLPAGARETLDVSGAAAFSSAGRSTPATLRLVDLADPLTAPLYRVESGTIARGGGDVALSTALAKRLGVRAGDRITVGAGQTAQVVGLLQDPWDTTSLFGVASPRGTLLPVLVAAPGPDRSYGWFVGLGVASAGPGRSQLVAGSLSGEYAVTTVDDAARSAEGGDARLLFAGETLLMAEIGLLVAAGFVVLARRRRRDLAMIGVAGGTAADRRRVVVTWGVLVGSLGALAGVLLGLGATAAAFGPLSDRLGRAPAHVRIDWPAVAGAFALAVVVSGFAAAWAARRVLAAPVLDGLRDRDIAAPRAGRSARTLTAALTAVTAAALVIAAFARVPLLGVLGLLGLLASAAVLLSWRLPAERPAPRPVALRLAVRDIERNGRRSAGLLVAVAGVVAVAVTVVGVLGGIAAGEADLYRPAVPADSVLIAGEPAVAATLPQIRRTLGAGATAAFNTAVAAVGNGEVQLVVDNPQLQCLAATGSGDGDACARRTGFHVLTPQLGIADAGAVGTILGRPLTAAESRAFQAGQALALNRRVVGPDGRLAVGPPGTGATARAHSLLRRTVPAVVVATDREYRQLPIAFLSPAGARQAGLTPSRLVSYYLPVPSRPSEANEDRARGVLLAADPNGEVVVERGDPSVSAMRRLTRGAFGVALASVAVVIAVAMALAGAELRGDLAVLSTVGAGRAIRRRVSTWEGVAMATGGALLGAAIGALSTVTLTRAVDVGMTWDGPRLAAVTILVAALIGAVTGRLSAPRRVQLRTRFE
jgi:putative ABC transport system permease protein